MDERLICGIEYSKEVIPSQDIRIVFGDGTNPMFEWVRLQEKSYVQDGFIENLGQDLFEIPMHTGLSLGIIVLIAGENADSSVCNAIERKLHVYLNNLKGAQHTGSRDNARLVFTLEFTRRLRFRDIGNYILDEIKKDFGKVVERAQIRFLVPLRVVTPQLEAAKRDWSIRDAEAYNVKDCDVKEFYSCAICQSLHPEHVCIITPEKSGMCGNVDYKVCELSYKLDNNGAYKPVEIGNVIDQNKGEFEGVNKYISTVANKEKRETIYDLVDAPEQITLQAECVAIVLPNCNGVMCMKRNYTGDNPSGISNMTITNDIHEATPALCGISCRNILETSFLKTHGGLERLIWINRSLKNDLLSLLDPSDERYNQIKSICDEKIATNEEDLLQYLKSNNNKVLEMGSLI